MPRDNGGRGEIVTIAVQPSTGIRVSAPARGRVPGDGVDLAFGYWPGRGTPIVAIHGVTGSHVQFVGIGERLAGRRPLLAPDLRGRGDSEKPDGRYGTAQHARDVAAAMRAFGLGPAVVIGHSMGAYIGTALAAEEPDLVGALVLFDGGFPPILPPDLPVQALLDKLIAPSMERLRRTFASREEYLDYWRSQPTLRPDEWGPWAEAYFDYDVTGVPLRAKASETAVRADFEDFANPDQAAGWLRRVKAPVMVLRAERGPDPSAPPVLPDFLLDRIRELIPDLELHDLPGTTHYTSVLADPGATQATDLLVAFAEKHSL